MDLSLTITSSRACGAAAVAGLALLALATPGCSSSTSDDAIASPEVPTIVADTGAVTRRDLVATLLVRGEITALPNRDVKLAAQVAGRVLALDVAEGDAVRAGQVLARIETRPLEDQRRQARVALDQARAALENAGANLERTERLFERGIAARKEVEDARAQHAGAQAAVEQAEAALDGADVQLARAQVASPIDGQVVKRFVGVGEQVDGTSAQPLVEVASVARVELAARVSADHLGRVRVGQRAAVTADAWPERSFAGEVVAIAPAVDPATNTALVRVRIANPEHLLKIGLFAQARLELQQKRGVLSVPPAAVARSDEGAAVYVVTGDQAVRTPVRLGLATEDAVEILAGVKAGQKVLTSAIHGLGERARLAPKP